ncbi:MULTISPECIES: toluene hydroxylase [unclassified Crossiella]|uniref:toluene hydroxylase n=1 Tax=unclassified Crossiella TaxID=2620835 RepID=UPI001FFFA7E9|nr:MULTISPECIES: toluene hydroxylase [unclassified Crossiella]MCK2239046.1 toluene hydroxylase [Crossiella sp. S99.2]MCK2251385.1 toluene hydroxylase [Crossiella sp. S99.1]
MSPLRTWSALAQNRRKPSEYEIVSHETNYTTRRIRSAPLEQSPTSPANLWLTTYRDQSRLQTSDWSAFRDPDALTYRRYVAEARDRETAVANLLAEFADAGHDATLSPQWRQRLRLLFTTTRYHCHAAQLLQSYLALLAPTSYLTNAASFAMADQLRRTSHIAYRTRELQTAWPLDGFGSTERHLWQSDPAWQPARRAMEEALATYDWGEAFTTANLVLLPTLDALLLDGLGAAAREAGDQLTWLLLENLAADSARRDRWSAAVVGYANARSPVAAEAIAEWARARAPLADAAVRALATVLEPEDPDAAEVLALGCTAARTALWARAGVRAVPR